VGEQVPDFVLDELETMRLARAAQVLAGTCMQGSLVLGSNSANSPQLNPWRDLTDPGKVAQVIPRLVSVVAQSDPPPLGKGTLSLAVVVPNPYP
jgi:hypothetical protein